MINYLFYYGTDGVEHNLVFSTVLSHTGSYTKHGRNANISLGIINNRLMLMPFMECELCCAIDHLTIPFFNPPGG